MGKYMSNILPEMFVGSCQKMEYLVTYLMAAIFGYHSKSIMCKYFYLNLSMAMATNNQLVAASTTPCIPFRVKHNTSPKYQMGSSFIEREIREWMWYKGTRMEEIRSFTARVITSWVPGKKERIY